MNILVTGAKGQVGQELKAIAEQYPDFNFVWSDRHSLDITRQVSVERLFSSQPFDYCINCAAYTAVDNAEKDVEKARAVNVEGVQYLAAACHAYSVRLIHLSTDYVYHNDSQNTPFVETDKTSPKGVYAQTKLAGEQKALAAPIESIVIRTSWVYGAYGNNFVKTMLRLGKDRKELTVIFDQIGSPTYAKDLAIAMLDIIQKNPTSFKGIYHYSNEGVCSWYDFATAIFELDNIDCQVLPIETKDYPTPAKRPPFSLLNKAKIKADFGLPIPYWRTSLKDCLERLGAEL